MPDYSVTFARSARKDLEKLPSIVVPRIIAHIEDLIANPRPSGAIKLQGNRGLWRIRIGDYRVIYGIDDSARTIDISAARHRRDAYRDF